MRLALALLLASAPASPGPERPQSGVGSKARARAQANAAGQPPARTHAAAARKNANSPAAAPSALAPSKHPNPSRRRIAPAGEQAQGFASRLFGAQLLWGGPRSNAHWGGAATQEGFGLISGQWVNFRYQDRLSLGGQGGAFHLKLALSLAVGAIYRVWSNHGWMARVGLSLDWQRGPMLRSTWVRVPELTLGWTGTQGALHYELAGIATPFLWHRGTEVAPRHKINRRSASIGALSTLVYRRLRFNFRADWSWLWPRPELQADLCLHFLSQRPKVQLARPEIAKRKAWFGSKEQRYRAGLCASAQSMAIAGTEGPLQTQRIAFSIMLGKISFLDPIR